MLNKKQLNTLSDSQFEKLLCNNINQENLENVRFLLSLNKYNNEKNYLFLLEKAIPNLEVSSLLIKELNYLNNISDSNSQLKLFRLIQYICDVSNSADMLNLYLDNIDKGVLIKNIVLNYESNYRSYFDGKLKNEYLIFFTKMGANYIDEIFETLKERLTILYPESKTIKQLNDFKLYIKLNEELQIKEKLPKNKI